MKKKGKKPLLEEVELERKDIEELLEKVREVLGEEAYQKLKTLFEAYETLTDLIREQGTTIRTLRKLLFGPATEKRKKVQGEGQALEGEPKEKKAKKRKGHGRNGAEAFPGAKKVEVPHESLKPGDPCPACGKGRVYEQREPKKILRFRGGAPVEVTVYKLQRLRCHLCGKIFTAKPPEGMGEEKYDSATAAMIGLLKYGSGMPFNRLEALQRALGIPLPGATQWEIVFEGARKLAPLYDAMIREAGRGEILHGDDTPVKIRKLLKKLREKKAQGKKKGKGRKSKARTGIHTTAVVSIRDGKKTVLFFSGVPYAGENLERVLRERPGELSPPLLMCDGSSQNLPEGFEVILANCLVHGRRQFLYQEENFPEEVNYVIQKLAQVYKNEKTARQEGMSAEERLAFHREKSGPVLEELKAWMKKKREKKEVEENSGLGQAIQYMEKRWDALTRFLEVPGAPLDNNVAERALKKAILHRKNALFYHSERGAWVGDTFMSILYTAQEAGVNALEYLEDLLENHKAVAEDPDPWLPWKWAETRAKEAQEKA